MYTQMVRIREFEERVKRTFLEHPGAMRRHTHLADGAEASIVGALASRNDTDFVMPSYRCHGYPIVLGTPPRNMMAESYGRKDGLYKGFGGSMHLADPARYFRTSGIIAAANCRDSRRQSGGLSTSLYVDDRLRRSSRG
jgi:TPP-dependent pyruvate/acetoin dehydrogenase alpha subunit